jgi:hypothetical protein
MAGVPDTFRYEFDVMITASALDVGDRLRTKPGGLAITVKDVLVAGKEVSVSFEGDARPTTFKKTDFLFVVR